MTRQLAVLVVDDDPASCSTMADILALEGFQATEATSGREAIERCERERFDFVLLDMVLPDIDGLETLSAIKRIAPKTRVIMITAHDATSLCDRALAAGAWSVFAKPASLAAFLLLLMTPIASDEADSGSEPTDGS